MRVQKSAAGRQKTEEKSRNNPESAAKYREIEKNASVRAELMPIVRQNRLCEPYSCYNDLFGRFRFLGHI